MANCIRNVRRFGAKCHASFRGIAAAFAVAVVVVVAAA
eukprot:CAMPEP_0202041656 /NCGR_PEP_ID=MMETSP0962-20130828/24734_1 /ASSEMBLY_ACC=CAM_ASM_000488 /TAXON_ID=4773 /ORGANISM="Schizochytrium aggregatum, Strain ATCC28209" /LENGTH=37 /DNA_ID= /DNA_START= /DNA_END= /DNA_ORIENTATION=